MLDNSVDSKLLDRRHPSINAPIALVRGDSGAASDTHIWRSCCMEMDARALLFFSQLLISLSVLIFCVCEIAVLDDAQWAKMTATFIIGVWLREQIGGCI